MSETSAEHDLAWDRNKSIKAQVHRLERTLEAGELKFSGDRNRLLRDLHRVIEDLDYIVNVYG